MSHSAGPWDVCPERTVFPRADRDWENLVGICDNNGSVLAFVFVDLPDGPETATTKARLMAAAPELLEALKEARYWLADGNRSTPSARGAQCGTIREVKSMIGRAIARAEGKK